MKKKINSNSTDLNNNSQPRDTMNRKYLLTINNPLDHGFDHAKIVSILQSFKSVIYWVLCDEIGEQGTPHTHIFFALKNSMRFSTVKNHFPPARIEELRGTPEQCRDYVKKEGKYLNSEKKATNIPETLVEWGTCPVNQQGKRNDIEELMDLIKSGHTDAELLDLKPELAFRNLDKIGKARTIYLTDLYKKTRRFDLKVNFVTGKTGMGKTRDILDRYGDENVFRVTDYSHPFDLYQLEPVIVFEEFRSSLRLQDMLNYLDIYPVTLPARYNPKVACYQEVYIVSNWTFEQEYAEIQKDSEQKATYAAWVRRFSGKVFDYTDAGIVEYPTMMDYLARNEEFYTSPTPTPFDKPEQSELSFEP